MKKYTFFKKKKKSINFIVLFKKKNKIVEKIWKKREKREKREKRKERKETKI